MNESEYEYEDYNLSDEEETEYIEADEVIPYVPIKIDEIAVQKEDFFHHETIYEEEEKPRNTSFQSYVSKKANKKGFKKWIIRFAKLILLLMCLPFIALVAGFAAAVAAAFLGGSLGLIGGGIVLLIGAAFFSSYLGGTLIMLGITASITLLASGTLGMILFVMTIKALISGLKHYYQKRKQNQTAEKEASEA